MKIGILVNPVDKIVKGKESDKLADEEVLFTARAITKVLASRHDIQLVLSRPRRLSEIRKFDFIFNLAESNVSSPLSEVDIAEYMELSNVPFSGAGSLTLKNCMDKASTKSLLVKNDIPTPQYNIFDDCERINTDLTYPLIVKPIHEDGSIGITVDSVVHDYDQLAKKVREVITLYKQPALVEEFIDGREISAAILGNSVNLEVLPLSEIVFTLPANLPRIVSFEAKWIKDSVMYTNTVGTCPAVVSAKTAKQIREIAKRAFQITGCRDYARVDFRLKDGIPYVLEVNPNPCINPDGSGFVRSALHAGYSYSDFVTKIVESACMRYQLDEKPKMFEKLID